MKKIITNQIRNIEMQFMAYTRSLELCSQMNYETENLDFIDQIEAGEVYYDLGACEGRFSIYAALKGINCYAFEPEAKNFKAFTENLGINQLTGKVKAHQLAVGDENKDGVINIGQPWEGGHQKVVEQNETRDDLDFEFTEKQNIKIVALDSFIEKNNLPLPHYLKIDVDGSEISFLEGAKNTIKSPSLKSIIFELSELDTCFEKIITTLQNIGWRIRSKHQIPNEEGLKNYIFTR